MEERNILLPKYMFLTKGVGKHRERLSSFELALRDAKIEKFNIVRVSSILPPQCKILTLEKGLELLQPGQVLYTVIAQAETNEPNRLISASIGVAIPADPSHYGYLSEHHSFGQTEKVCGEYAEDLAATMLATTLGLEFDPAKAWDEREQEYKMSGKIVKTRNHAQSALGDKDGLWTTVVSAAVLVPDFGPNKPQEPAPGQATLFQNNSKPANQS
jgi:arginine decarboxylase